MANGNNLTALARAAANAQRALDRALADQHEAAARTAVAKEALDAALRAVDAESARAIRAS